MIQVNANAWDDWDKMLEYIHEMHSVGFKIQIVNGGNLLELLHGEELKEMGFTANVA